MNTIIEKIRVEIEHRRDLNYKYYVKQGIGSSAEYRYDEDVKILSIISGFENSEKPTNPVLQEQPVCEGLEEAVVDYFEGYWPGMETAEQCNTDLHFTPPAIMRLARHFAQWQMEQMKRFVEENIGRVSILFADAVARDAIDHEFRKCDFKNGAEWVIGKVTIEEVTK